MLNPTFPALAILVALAACTGPRPGPAADGHAAAKLAEPVEGEHLQGSGESWGQTAREAAFEAWLDCCFDLIERCRPLGREGGSIQAVGGPACDETATEGHHCVARCEGRCVYGRPTALGDPDPTEITCPLPGWLR